MNKYLIFRTDRIGDFLISAVLLKCIKINDPSSHITVVASSKNFSYIKKFNYVDEVLELKNNFYNKLKIIIKLRKIYFKNIIVHDDKKRSKFITSFLKANKKIYLHKKEEFSHIKLIKTILLQMDFFYFKDSLNTIDHKSNIVNKEKIVQLHFDEKWIYNDYIKKFVNIEPSKDELLHFMRNIIKETNKELIITTGFQLPYILRELVHEITDMPIKLHDNLNFSELEKITLKSNFLISCHGAISHVAAAQKITQVDIIDDSYDYKRWTEHFRSYNYLYREKFNILSKKIINKLINFNNS